MVFGKLMFAIAGMHLCRFIGENAIGGLILGTIIGHVFDVLASVKLSQLKTKRLIKQHVRKEFQEHFLSSLFHMLGKLCAADGAVTKEEIQAVDQIIKERLSLSKADRKIAISHFRAARTSSTAFQSSAVRFFELHQEHPDILEGTIRLLLTVALADGPLQNDELRLIRAATSVFGIDEESLSRLTRLHAEHASDAQPIEKSYEVLGCASDTSVEEIKKSYRKLVSTYHPDKIVSKDLPDEFIKFANQKMRDIQAAYEAVRAHKGF